MFIKEHNFPDLYNFIIIESVAAERFNQYLLLIIPETECIVLVYDADPIFYRMHGDMFYSASLVCVELEDYFHP